METAADKYHLSKIDVFETQLAELEDEYGTIVYNMDDVIQRERAGKDRVRIAGVITELDAAHKEIKAPLAEAVKKIDGARKQIKDRLEAMRVRIHDQQKEYQRKLDEYQEMLNKKLTDILEHKEFPYYPPIDELVDRITALENIVVDESYEHLQEQAIKAKIDTLDYLKTMHADAEEKLKQAKELEALKEKQRKEEQIERENKLIRDADENAKKEERARIEAEDRKKQEAIDAENRAKEEEEKKAERKRNNKLHKEKVEREAHQSMYEALFDVEEELVERVMHLIINDNVKHVTINY